MIFDNYSEIYDSVYSTKPYKQEAADLINIIKKLSGPSSSILDMGCGTGKHAIELASDGFEVLGIDISQKMINVAKDRAIKLPPAVKRRLDFQCADLVSFESERKFDIVLSMFHVINYMITPDLLRNFYATAKSNLTRHGILIHDSWNAAAINESSFIPRELDFEVSGKKISRISNYQHDSSRQRVEISFSFTSEEISQKICDTWYESHEIMYFTPAQLTNAASLYFKCNQILDQKTFNNYTDETFSALYVFAKLNPN